jgi:hypothetical protein
MAKKAPKKKAMAALEGNIIEHMRLMADLKEQKNKHFHFDSEIWKAICKSVSYDDDLIAHPKDYLIMSYRGTGRAVSLRNVQLYGKDYTVKPVKEHHSVGFEIEVEYTHEDNNGMDHPPTTTKSTTLQVPMKFLIKFSPASFKTWVKKVKAERDAETKEKDLEKLKELREKYPDA